MSSLPPGVGYPPAEWLCSLPGRAVGPAAGIGNVTFKLSISPLAGLARKPVFPLWGNEGCVRGHCSSSESPQQSEGSNQVTFQGIRQTVGIKSFTWKLALYLQALLLSPSPTLYFCPFYLQCCCASCMPGLGAWLCSHPQPRSGSPQ